MCSRGTLFIFSNGNFFWLVGKFFSFKTGIPGGLADGMESRSTDAFASDLTVDRR